MNKVVFLDMREEGLSLFIIEKNRDRWELRDRVDIPDQDLPSDIEKTFKDVRESYLSLPLSLLDFRIVKLPFHDLEKVREVLPFELDSLVLGGSAAVVFDACILEKNNDKYDVLATYIPKDNLRRILGKFEKLKIVPRIVTSIELASVMNSPRPHEGIIEGLLDSRLVGGEDRIKAVIKEIDRPTINLRRGEFAHTADTERTKKSLKLTAILMGVLMLIFLSDTGFRIISTEKEISAVKDEIRKTYQGLFPEEKKITSELYQMKAHLRELKEKEKAFIGVSPLQFLLDLTTHSISGAIFNDITIDKERVVLKGECRSLSDVQEIKSALEEFLRNVNISDAKSLSQDRTTFTITAKEKD
ncbi:MAG: GspL/Epsl periplasmic domain-containing protein [Nitrospirota bacterium]